MSTRSFVGVMSDAGILGAYVHDHKRPGQTITRRGWQAVRPSQLAQWSAGQFINLYPTRREAVAYLTGKDAE